MSSILKATSGRLTSSDGNKRIAGISIDSRTIKRGEIFIAIKGKRFDGHDFIAQAVKKGACGIVVRDRTKDIPKEIPAIFVKDTVKALGDIAAYHRNRFDIPVIGVTGSNGKTTVKDMIAHILGKRYNILKNRGTENNLIGLPMTLLRLNKDHSLAVLEIGANHHGEIARLTDILKPAMGIITNIGPSHLEFFKDKEGVLKAKSEMVHKLKENGLLILNGDDPSLSRLRPKCRVLRFGLTKINDFRATEIESDRYISFVLNGLYPLRINLLGIHNLYNALASIAAALNFGMGLSLIKRSLLDFRSPSMRMELERINGIDVINDAYNSNPLSFKWAVLAFSNFKSNGKKILIMGDMLELGKKGRLYHSSAGRLIAASSIDVLIALGRFSKHVAMGAKESGMKDDRLWPCHNLGEAKNILKKIVKKGDAVLVKGSRNLSMERIIDSLG